MKYKEVMRAEEIKIQGRIDKIQEEMKDIRIIRKRWQIGGVNCQLEHFSLGAGQQIGTLFLDSRTTAGYNRKTKVTCCNGSN